MCVARGNLQLNVLCFVRGSLLLSVVRGPW